MVITCAEISIVMCYFQLGGQVLARVVACLTCRTGSGGGVRSWRVVPRLSTSSCTLFIILSKSWKSGMNPMRFFGWLLGALYLRCFTLVTLPYCALVSLSSQAQSDFMRLSILWRKSIARSIKINIVSPQWQRSPFLEERTTLLPLVWPARRINVCTGLYHCVT